jgi:hypothetical protein
VVTLEAVPVPDQKFSDPTTGAELVSVHWDFGLTSVDVSFGGTLLTKITDINQLRVAGMGGTTPDGGSLILRLGFADAFEVTRNGERLTASDVNAFSHTPVSGTLLDGSSAADTKLALDKAGRLVLGGKRVDEHAMGMIKTSNGNASSAYSAVSTARGWLLFFAIVQTFFSLAFGWATYAVFAVTDKLDPSDLNSGSTDSAENAALFAGILEFLKGFVLILFLFVLFCAIGSWILWKVAATASARKAFTVSKWVAVGYFVLSLLGGLSGLADKQTKSIGQSIVMIAISAVAFKAFSKAQSVLPED